MGDALWQLDEAILWRPAEQRDLPSVECPAEALMEGRVCSLGLSAAVAKIDERLEYARQVARPEGRIDDDLPRQTAPVRTRDNRLGNASVAATS